MEIRPLATEFFHADERTDGRTDRQTEMTKLIVTFSNSANAPKNSLLYLLIRKSFRGTNGWLNATQFAAQSIYSRVRLHVSTRG